MALRPAEDTQEQGQGSVRPSLLLDASIYIFQYYFSLPDNWFSVDDFPTGAVYGYTTFLLRLLEAEKPRRIAACYDESLGTCFRNKIYPDYKSSRAYPDEALSFQLAACREVGELLGVASFASTEYEADDLLGTLAKRLRRNEAPIAILTRDKDLGQLLSRPQDYLWDYSKDQRFHASGIKRKFGVEPNQLVDYLALVGDSIDDIPGVPGCGPKTAQALLHHHYCIDTVFDCLHELKDLPLRGAKGLADKLLAHREQIGIARRLALIVDHVPIAFKVADLHWSPGSIALESLAEFCERMGFPRLIARIERLARYDKIPAITA